MLAAEAFAQCGRGLRQGDRSAFTELFEGTYEALYRYAWSFTKDEESAYDVLQDVFLRLWQIRAHVDPSRSLKALLYQMVRNNALNHLRRMQRNPIVTVENTAELPSRDAGADVAYDIRALGQRIQLWIDSMPPRRREAFVLSRYQGLSHDEIAKVMNLTPKTVNNHIVLALTYLRDKIDSLEPELT